jgi:hypothetical protein
MYLGCYNLSMRYAQEHYSQTLSGLAVPLCRVTVPDNEPGLPHRYLKAGDPRLVNCGRCLAKLRALAESLNLAFPQETK